MKHSSKEDIPYSSEALRQDLARVRVAWEGAQSSRDRNAIYGYLTAVYGLVAWWTAESRDACAGRFRGPRSVATFMVTSVPFIVKAKPR